MEKFLQVLRNLSVVVLLIGVFLLALPVEEFIVNTWIWPLVVVGGFGLILYFAIYFTYTRGN